MFLIICASGVYGQGIKTDTVVVTPGDKSISGKRFFNYENVWEMTNVDQAGKIAQIGMWYDTLRIEAKQEKVLERKQTVKYSNGHTRVHYDEVKFETLEPIITKVVAFDKDSKLPNIITDIQYVNNTIRGVRRFNVQGSGPESSLPVKTEIQLKESVFDWHLWGILVAGFPLQNNYAARFLVHTSTNTTNSPFLWITLKVEGSEIIYSKQWGKVDCWKVLVNAEVPWTFWIAKSHRVAPIQMIKIDQTSMGEGTAWWKPLR